MWLKYWFELSSKIQRMVCLFHNLWYFYFLNQPNYCRKTLAKCSSFYKHRKRKIKMVGVTNSLSSSLWSQMRSGEKKFTKIFFLRALWSFFALEQCGIGKEEEEKAFLLFFLYLYSSTISLVVKVFSS